MKSCREIVDLLSLYRTLVMEALELQPDAEITLASSYSFISIEAGDFHVEFQISPADAKLYKIHCPSVDDVKKRIESMSWPGLDTSSKQPLPDDVNNNLTAADTIASLAHFCAKGDDYHPGNFSKVILATDRIELQQINYMNAKSLDHKKDYSLRSLVFRIPLGGNAKMITEFTDRSSDNNRHCGDKIKAAIDWLPH